AALVSPHSSPSAQAERRELAALVADQLARLPAHYREVIVLRNLEGLPFDEVARRMKRTAGAVPLLFGVSKPGVPVAERPADAAGRQRHGHPPRGPRPHALGLPRRRLGVLK